MIGNNQFNGGQITSLTAVGTLSTERMSDRKQIIEQISPHLRAQKLCNFLFLELISFIGNDEWVNGDC